MKTAAIIQARMGSTRLPGKVLLDLGGETVLARVVRRLGRAKLLDEVLVATTTASADDAIVGNVRGLESRIFAAPSWTSWIATIRRHRGRARE